jgi:hypothetical protein
VWNLGNLAHLSLNWIVHGWVLGHITLYMFGNQLEKPNKSVFGLQQIFVIFDPQNGKKFGGFFFLL